MNIYITFDYELYFGSRPGSVEKCILYPARLLSEMAERQGIRLVQFVDAGFLVRMKDQVKQFSQLSVEYNAVLNQLKHIWKNGHDIQLHIHPHWEDSFYNGNEWVINTIRYRLADFKRVEISDIVNRYKSALEEITGKDAIYAFRAGGWCIQPFECMRDALFAAGVRIDSSVFPDAVYKSRNYDYDFRNSPKKSEWKFSNDPLKEDNKGVFTEIAISGIYNNPLFYWKLFLLGRLFPARHKPIGDGIAMHAPGQRKKLLTQFTHQTVSVDGYNANLLNRALREHEKKNATTMVIIGHPKSLTMYGLEALEKFIEKNKDKHRFTTFREQKAALT